MYKIKDLQQDKYFANGSLFKNKKEACEQLISYHSADCNMEEEQRLLDEGRVDECWNELSAFEWELEKV